MSNLHNKSNNVFVCISADRNYELNILDKFIGLHQIAN